MQVKGTGTRFDTILFGQHCGGRDHKRKCEAIGIEPMPAVLVTQKERKEAGTLVSVLERASASATALATPPAAGALAALQAEAPQRAAALVATPPPGGALVATPPLDGALVVIACRGALLGDRYLGLAHSAGARSWGSSSEVITETYECSLECGVPVVRALGCHRERATSSPCSECRNLAKTGSGTINQRADRRLLAVAKVEMLELVLQDKPVTERVAGLLSKETIGAGGKKKEGEKKLLVQAASEEQMSALVASLNGISAPSPPLCSNSRLNPPCRQLLRGPLCVLTAPCLLRPHSRACLASSIACELCWLLPGAPSD